VPTSLGQLSDDAINRVRHHGLWRHEPEGRGH
jgi:hypothetical protein